LAQNVYECMFIFDSNAYARDPHGVSGRIAKMVEKCGGEMLASRLWFEQKLAYQINGQRKGTYWLTFFRMAGERIAEFNRECQLDDNILRNLTLKVDPRTVDVRVSQASGQRASTEEPAGEAATVPSEPAGEAATVPPEPAGEAATVAPESAGEAEGEAVR
jgi:small subunit ribosomal protein S6